MKIILGIDPGSRVTGYGLVASEGSKTTCVAFGEINVQGQEVGERLYKIYQGILEVIQTYQPQGVAIEAIFMHQNPNSALKLGQARGVALVAAAISALPIAEYSARQIKQAIVGYGAAEKNQMQQMVCALLKLKEKPKPDAADALAIALCHCHSSRLAEKLQKIA